MLTIANSSFQFNLTSVDLGGKCFDSVHEITIITGIHILTEPMVRKEFSG